MKIVFAYGGPNPYPPHSTNTPQLITMHQREDGSCRFRVTYGLQVRNNLTYAQAAKELGECIMHHLACESIIENQGD